MLAEFGFTFDLCVNARQIPNATRLVEQCPHVGFMLDHIGNPQIKEKQLEPWRKEIKALSAFPNVHCKVSSVATGADHQHWTIEDLQPYVDHIFECFGFDRTVFAGDWPVSLLAAELPVCVETLEKLLDGATEAQLKKLFYSNAIEFYKL